MATRKTDEELIADKDAQIERLKAERRKILKRKSEKERKERNHRLIQLGAEVEAVIGEPVDVDVWKRLVRSNPDRFCERYRKELAAAQGADDQPNGTGDATDAPAWRDRVDAASVSD